MAGAPAPQPCCYWYLHVVLSEYTCSLILFRIVFVVERENIYTLLCKEEKSFFFLSEIYKLKIYNIPTLAKFTILCDVERNHHLQHRGGLLGPLQSHRTRLQVVLLFCVGPWPNKSRKAIKYYLILEWNLNFDNLPDVLQRGLSEINPSIKKVNYRFVKA